MKANLTGVKCSHCERDLTFAEGAINVSFDMDDLERQEKVMYPSKWACSQECADILANLMIMELGKGYEVEREEW